MKIGDTVWWNRSLISFQNAQVLLLLMMGVKVRPPWPQDGRRRGRWGWRQGDHNVNRRDANITNRERDRKSIRYFNFSTFFLLRLLGKPLLAFSKLTALAKWVLIILDNTIIINLLFISITFKRRVIPNKWLGDRHPLPIFFRTFKHLLPLEPWHRHEVQEAFNSKFWLATEQKVELPQRNDAQPQLRTSWPQNNSAFYASFLFVFSIVIFNATHYYYITNIM